MRTSASICLLSTVSAASTNFFDLHTLYKDSPEFLEQSSLGKVKLIAEHHKNRVQQVLDFTNQLTPHRTAPDCLNPISDGDDTCNKPKQRWRFNEDLNTCEEYTYTGCGGTTNNFFTQADCDRVCKPHVDGTFVAIEAKSHGATGDASQFGEEQGSVDYDHISDLFNDHDHSGAEDFVDHESGWQDDEWFNVEEMKKFPEVTEWDEFDSSEEQYALSQDLQAEEVETYAHTIEVLGNTQQNIILSTGKVSSRCLEPAGMTDQSSCFNMQTSRKRWSFNGSECVEFDFYCNGNHNKFNSWHECALTCVAIPNANALQKLIGDTFQNLEQY